jgi:hypothetical protein
MFLPIDPLNTCKDHEVIKPDSLTFGRMFYCGKSGDRQRRKKKIPDCRKEKSFLKQHSDGRIFVLGQH